MVPIGEETWPPGVIKSKGVHEWGMLHVSDWHLGRMNGNTPRREDLADVLDQTVEAAREFSPDLVVHAGDLFDGPRPVICADCGVPIEDGKVIHFKPERYAVRYHGQTFYLERHLGVTCGCAAKRGFV